ncbi:ATPase, T2SS/T4P/T4SS family [Ralstonia soli]|uniref:Flp pilus assembly complex ATPase component TadA n=1 Tax=Ralstonia soli TaxID=2953896 RepID=A0ABT1AEW1_9RALS|nr:ATPase, T2SS/T4P/T4SS family [Ralstonia soli]MCO5396864.1 Flp pilus assembly complex ATPase component TadA [Ralstonia soli]
MLRLTITGRDGSSEVRQIGQACTIGKDPSCDIVLKGFLIGKLHAKILNREGRYYLEDEGGIASTLINGNPVTSYGPLTPSDKIEIGSYLLSVMQEQGQRADIVPPGNGVPDVNGVHGANGLNGLNNGSTSHASVAGSAQAYVNAMAHAPSAAAPAPVRQVPPAQATPVPVAQPVSHAAPVAARPPAPTPAPAPAVSSPPARDTHKATREEVLSPINSPHGIELRKAAHQALINAMDLRRVNVARMEEDELRKIVGGLLDEILAADARYNTPTIPRDVLKKSVFDEVIGLGPLEELLEDEAVTEIMVNRHDEIFIERSGRLAQSSVIFTDDRAVLGAIERIVAPLGRRIDESSPMVDARLKDGSRVNAVIPPLALKGPNITIRKFSKRKLQGSDLVQFGSLSPQMVEFLRVAVERRANIVISGGTGSGKTTLLNVLSNFIPEDERIVTVEDAAELQLAQPNLVSLEARPPNMEGKGAVTIRDLVKNCLRMRPDRIVVGECRGGEALDMLQAMNTGHDGSLTTAHANSPRDCLSRLEVMTLMAGLDLPVQAIREQVCSAVDIIVQQTRFSCGSRRVTYITEVSGMETGVVQLQDVFVFKEEGYGSDGRVKGRFVSTSYIPDFYQDLIRRGIPVDTSIFGEQP